MKILLSGQEVSSSWDDWCGKTSWSQTMQRFGELGGKVRWWGGMPRSASAIPLCFELYTSDGRKIEGGSRLKDIHAAVRMLEGEEK